VHVVEGSAKGILGPTPSTLCKSTPVSSRLQPCRAPPTNGMCGQVKDVCGGRVFKQGTAFPGAQVMRPNRTPCPTHSGGRSRDLGEKFRLVWLVYERIRV
jgi:hypothetical protein